MNASVHASAVGMLRVLLVTTLSMLPAFHPALAMEAAEFQRGNFADPAYLHGAAMPGLRELRAGAPRMRIAYRKLPSGAEISFKANDIKLITAVHRWFGAQLSEHGADARTE